MASTEELIDMICTTIKSNLRPIPISLMNQTPQMALEIIVGVCEKCAQDGIVLQHVHIDPELANILNLTVGQTISSQSSATYSFDDQLGRQVSFERPLLN